MELVDHWDPVDHQGSDTELAVVVAALCVGIAFTAATVALLHRLRPAALLGFRNLPLCVPLFASAPHGGRPNLRGSPPTSLRI